MSIKSESKSNLIESNSIDINIDLKELMSTIPRLYKRKSNVWKYYSSECDSLGKCCVRCSFCGMRFSHYTSKNATKLKQHLIHSCKQIPVNIKQLFTNHMQHIQHKPQTVTNHLNNSCSDESEQNKDSVRIKRQTTSVSSVKVLMKEVRVPVVTQVSKLKKLEEVNQKLSSRLRICLKQNSALINVTQHITKCLQIMKKLDFLKSKDKLINELEINDLNRQLSLEEEETNHWKLKYESIEAEEANNENNICGTQGTGHKKQSSIWKYFKFVEKNDSDGYKTIKCIFCDKFFRQKVLNAFKCRTHIVDKCDKCPQHIKEEEDIMVEPHAKSKINIWQHFIVNEEEGKSSTECSYCGITYSGKNATKCREHLLAKCEKIPANIKETICNQCDEDFLRNLQQPIRSKVSIWEHYHISEDEGKINCRCIYCGTIYAHKNATKCREHLTERCAQISDQIRRDIANQCEETPSRTWTQTKIPIWEHYIINEDEGKISCECNYCGITYATKNATKCRIHLISKCDKIPYDVKQRICNESGDAYLNVLEKKSHKKSNYLVRQRKHSQKCTPLGKAGRPKCQIWQYFADEFDSEGRAIRRCIYCETAFGYRTSRNATKLRDHIALNCKTVPSSVRNKVDSEDGFVRTVKDYHQREEERRLECPWPGCDLAFPKRSRLLKHQLVHTGSIVKIKCDWPGCDWSGRDRFSVKIHKYRHTGEKPWTCDWPGCDFRTAKPSSLYIHKLRHNNIRRFKCEWPGCERAFLTNSQRKVHKMVHLGLKPYACQLCDKCFPAPNKLKLHQNKQHSIQEIIPQQ